MLLPSTRNRKSKAVIRKWLEWHCLVFFQLSSLKLNYVALYKSREISSKLNYLRVVLSLAFKCPRKVDFNTDFNHKPIQSQVCFTNSVLGPSWPQTTSVNKQQLIKHLMTADIAEHCLTSSVKSSIWKPQRQQLTTSWRLLAQKEITTQKYVYVIQKIYTAWVLLNIWKGIEKVSQILAL